MLSTYSAHKIMDALCIPIDMSEYKIFQKMHDDVNVMIHARDDTTFKLFMETNLEHKSVRQFYKYYKHINSELLMYDYIEKHTSRNRQELIHIICTHSNSNIELVHLDTRLVYDCVCIIQIFHFIAHSISLLRTRELINEPTFTPKRHSDTILYMFKNVKKERQDINQIVKDISNDSTNMYYYILGNLRNYSSQIPDLFKIIEYVRNLDENTIKLMKITPDFEILLPYNKLKGYVLNNVRILVKYSLVYDLVTEYNLRFTSADMTIKVNPDKLTEINDVIEV